jgi:hypothetical protein
METGTASQFTEAFDRTPVGIDDSLGDKQSKTGSMAFCGAIRTKKLSHSHGIDSAAVVGDSEFNPVLLLCRGNGNSAALSCGIDRIQNQIEYDLDDLIANCFD